MQGAESVLIEIDGPPEEVEARLLAVPGVHSVSRKNGHGGRTSWEIETGKESNIRGELARTVVESGWGLFEIRSIGMSLEDIFLKLTASDAAEAATEEPPESSDGETASTSGSEQPVADGSLDETAVPLENDEASKQEGAGPS